MFRSAPVAALAIAMTVSGCFTSYTPRPGPRLSVIMENGQPVYMRDGKRFAPGVFGDGLIEAVEGVPLAEEHARAFRDINVASLATVLGGAGLAVGGIVLAANGVKAERPVQQQVGGVVVITGLVSMIVGGLIIAAAPPRQLDAINAYNDAVEERRRTLWPIDDDEGSPGLKVDKKTRRPTLAGRSASVEGQHPAIPALPIWRF